MRYQNGCGLNTIGHFRNKKGTGPEMRPTILFLDRYWGRAVQQLASFFPCAYWQSQKALRTLIFFQDLLERLKGYKHITRLSLFHCGSDITEQ